jgi:biopolymer transport protein ExbB
MWDFIRNHWYFAIPMFGMTFTALTLVIWRILLNINAQTNMNVFMPVFQEKLEKEGVVGALRYCQSQPGVIPRRLFASGLEVSKQGLAAMRRAMANVIELEILPDLNFLLPSILAIAKIATMVGLLGTVISMINTFGEIGRAVERGEAASGKSREIGLALYATAIGLVTAIPLVFSHVLFKAWVAKFEVRMKSAAQKLLILVQAAKPAPGAAPATAAVPAAAVPAKSASDSGIAVRR